MSYLLVLTFICVVLTEGAAFLTRDCGGKDSSRNSLPEVPSGFLRHPPSFSKPYFGDIESSVFTGVMHPSPPVPGRGGDSAELAKRFSSAVKDLVPTICD